jgi:hypothetical protein
MKRFIAIMLTAGLFAGNAIGYGGRGHRLVGAIADRRLAVDSKIIQKKIAVLLDGLTLEEVATLADGIKDWDPKKEDPNNPRAPREPFHVKGHPKIEAQLRAFVNANPGPDAPFHREFHYTDVPVAGSERYADGQIGRAPYDVVQMIPFCIRVLKGQIPEDNKRAITKAVAIILLAHFVGDLHQPLHVGAAFFDAKGNPIEPTRTRPGFGSQGGNKLTFFVLDQGRPFTTGNLHSYWDGQTVTNAFGDTPDGQLADDMAKNEPANWKPTSGIENWGEELANEMMPIAREAHERLEFKNIKTDPGTSDILSGDAVERTPSSGPSYAKWSGQIVKQEIHKAGWRLAALLEAVLQ